MNPMLIRTTLAAGLTLSAALLSLSPRASAQHQHGAVADDTAASAVVANRTLTLTGALQVIDAAKAVAIPMDREILHILPQEFTVDDQKGIKDPTGMAGIRLEVDVHIVTGAVSSAQSSAPPGTA